MFFLRNFSALRTPIFEGGEKDEEKRKKRKKRKREAEQRNPPLNKKKKKNPAFVVIPLYICSLLSSHVVFLRLGNVLPIVRLLPPKRSKSLLLGHGVDISPDNEGDEVKERHPRVGWQELLRE